MTSLLLEHPVEEAQPLRLELTTGQILEKVRNNLRLLIVSLILYNVQELIKLDHTRAILIHKVYQILHLLNAIHKPKANQRTFDLIDANRPRIVIIQPPKTLPQSDYLIVLKV